jgi:dihydrofolate synthase / folylpolyglutamate synthase
VDDLLTDYGEAIAKLFARTTSGTKFGLERTRAILSELGSPERSFPSIHIAGTNGKGSVVATTEALLRAKGLRVGRYTSPHLIDFRERISVDSVPISEEAVLRFLEKWIPLAEATGATFFELTTALAFEWFAAQAVDIAVVETGLGGRLDSTNVLTPRVATVTSIGLDHTDLLGDTLEQIAREKAGIFKSGVPAVIGEERKDIRDLLEKCATETGSAPVIVLDDEYTIRDIGVSTTGTSFTMDCRSSRDVNRVGQGNDQIPAVSRSERITTPLIGVHQARNTVIALATVRALDKSALSPSNGAMLTEMCPTAKAISAAISQTFLPGRFQPFGKFIFDVAHNPDGARTVANTIAGLPLARPIIAVLAVLADKDWQGIIDVLRPAVDQFILTDAPSAPADRRWNPEHAAAFAKSISVIASLIPDFDRALEVAEQSAATVLVTGSFHTVGDAMSRLQVSPFAA